MIKYLKYGFALLLTGFILMQPQKASAHQTQISSASLVAVQGFLAAESITTSYLNPFPPGGVYKILVIGDGYADGLSLGMKKALENNKSINIFREISYSASLIPRGRTDWVQKLDLLLRKENYDIAVIMIGLRDRKSVALEGQSYDLETPEWRDYYRNRISQVIRKLKSQKIATYWVGLPIVRGSRTSGDFKTINDAFRVQTASAQIKYIDNWLHFANEDGQFTQYGPDVEGKIRLLRKKDGLFFTRAGYEKLGHFVSRLVQRDLREAKAERNVPLFGDVPEQDYLLRRHALDDPKNKRRRAALLARNQGKSINTKLKKLTGVGLQRNKYDTAKHTSVTITPDKSMNGKPTVIQIVRPAIPAAAFKISRRASGAGNIDGDPNGAEILEEPLGDTIGLALSSVSQQLLSNNSQLRLPLTQTPYYKLLVRGDALETKPGRADHLIWTDSSVEKSSKMNKSEIRQQAETNSENDVKKAEKKSETDPEAKEDTTSSLKKSTKQ